MASKILFASVAVLFLATGTAHAIDLKTLGCEEGACRPPIDTQFPKGDELPKAFFSGKWCHDPYISVKTSVIDQNVYYPPDLKESGMNYEDRKMKACPFDSIIINLDGYDEETKGDTQAFCAFTEIKEKEKRVSYLIHMRCITHDADQKETFEEDVEFQLINELLFIKRAIAPEPPTIPVIPGLPNQPALDYKHPEQEKGEALICGIEQGSCRTYREPK
jgi:hypothetical protein